MDYRRIVKFFDLPEGYVAPTELAYEDIRARAITRKDLQEDVKGINASLEIIRRTRGGDWPSEPTTEEDNYAYLVWHELEFREGYSFAYAVYDVNNRYLGCCYLYPMGRRGELDDDLIKYDVDVSWWVTPPAYDQGYYVKLYQGLQQWIAGDFPFDKAYYSNAEIPS
ncbi:GNAT family N-acetyltransferase [Actinocrispum wychmicini]|uniref:N-acetyltransferase domain-containing protein n=1 Tax=Actinocrispum wychmicini TaxID=1213861 RepID=A0A4R2J998_9PSEU|nr:GNAT family N-acetyltransferase [Actinocrispum wychmicini]TCO54362.1 hypothetical protein EV192_109343 [Actinocrispum wychmicini]